MKENKNTLMWVLFGCAIVVVFLLPNIYSFINKITTPKVPTNTSKPNEEVVKTVPDEVLAEIHVPAMRTSKYSSTTYYSLDTFTNSDLSNSDKLYNAFMYLEKVNINNNSFAATYMDLIIDNVLGRNIEYNLDRFYVPIDSKSDYKGYWNYYNGVFTYQGGNAQENTNIEYYNLEQKIKAEYEKRDIIVYYYVGFAKVEGNKYTIYSDPDMTKQIASGEASVSELNDIFNKINNIQKRIYKYTFKNTICSYSEYCLYEGKWVNGI